MPDTDPPPFTDDLDNATMVIRRPRPRRQARRLPAWNVLLHNDDVSEMDFVANTIVELTSLPRQDAVLRMLEAHHTGVALLVQTHREHAELLREQFASKRLIVTIEPD